MKQLKIRARLTQIIGQNQHCLAHKVFFNFTSMLSKISNLPKNFRVLKTAQSSEKIKGKGEEEWIVSPHTLVFFILSKFPDQLTNICSPKFFNWQVV